MNNTLIKGLKLLETLARHGEPMGVTELGVAAGMPKSCAHRLLQSLVDQRYVVRHGPGSYIASIKLWELGSAALSAFDLRRHAESVMEALMEQTGETVHLSVLDGYEVVYVHKVDSLNPVRAYTQIGGRAAAHCVATGKAMMAFRNARWLVEATTRLSAATPHSVTEPKAFLAEMQRVRRNGFACNRGEWRAEVNGLAAPIFDPSGAVIAALGISGPSSRLRPARLRELAPAVCEGARKLSSGLGEAAPHASLRGVTQHWGSLG